MSAYHRRRNYCGQCGAKWGNCEHERPVRKTVLRHARNVAAQKVIDAEKARKRKARVDRAAATLAVIAGATEVAK